MFENRSYSLDYVDAINSTYNDKGFMIEIDWEKSKEHPKFNKDKIVERLKKDLRREKRALRISVKDSYADYVIDEDIHPQNVDYYLLFKEQDLETLEGMSEEIEIKELEKKKIGLNEGREMLKAGFTVNQICEEYEFKRKDYEFTLREEEQNA